MFSRIDPKELDQNVFSMIGEQWMLGHRRDGGAVQHHDGQLGRPGRAVGKAGGHGLHPPPAVHPGICGAGGLLHPLLLRGGVPEGPGPVRLQERPGRG